MHGPRYVVLSQSGEWKILQGTRRYASYQTKSDAMCAAIGFAEKDADAGREAEVLVRHEDGRFLLEWMFGHDLQARNGTPIPMTARK
jgi:hypothetical protein